MCRGVKVQVKLTKRSQGTRRFTRIKVQERARRVKAQSAKAGALTMWSAGNLSAADD